MDISLSNCNNIDTGTIHIEDGRLNIKYAINGTGKSTIAHALSSKIKGEVLSELRPFKYRTDTDENHNPQVIISTPVQSIAIFNEEYINKYAFKKDELVENSFEIFVKTERYEEHMTEISNLVSSIQNAFLEDPELDSLITDLGTFISSLGNTQNGYSKASDFGKTIGKGNNLDNIPADLEVYTPYLRLRENNKNINWLKWQSEGKDYLDITDKCPYCVSTIETPRDAIVRVSMEYDSKSLTILVKMLEVITSLGAYFTTDTLNAITLISQNATGITGEQIEFLRRLKDEIIQLRDKLNKLKYISFSTLKDVDRVVDALNESKVNLTFYPQLNCDYTNRKIENINTSLQAVIDVAGRLQGQISQQKEEIRRTIEKYSDEINDFLKTAGYQYEVSIPPTGDNYRLILSYIGQTEGIMNVKNHLSYGERNAFALVLFMYQTLKKNSDIIVLDDPISSFDNNKKYAIMTMLFRGNSSFRGKTVLMLTHDFEPIIDILCVLPDLFSPGAKAYFIANIGNIIEEKAITSHDVKSYISVCKSNILESADVIHKLIYLRRLLEMNGNKGLAWELVSNVFHKGRDVPQIKSVTGTLRDFTVDEIIEATRIIKDDIEEFDYYTIYARTIDRNAMVALYRSSASGYEKVQIYRILFDGDMERGAAMKKYVDETFHIQNDFLFQLNPREYEIVPQYVLVYCDNEVNSLDVPIHA